MISMIACIAMGISVFITAMTVMFLRGKPPVVERSQISYDDELRGRLRIADPVYRNFELLVEEVSWIVKSQVSPDFLAKLQHSLEVCLMAPPWNAMRFTSSKVVEGLLAGVAVGAVVILATGFAVVAAIMVVVIAIAYAGFSVYSVIEQADVRTRRIRNRMSFATDLMALVMQAGGNQSDVFQSVVKENADHPIGEEFGIVVSQTQMGQSRAKALRGFRDRYPDPDIADFVFAVIKSEELGTPLAQALNLQAAQMRLKHSQWCEKQAAEAGVQMTFPSLLTMLACIIVILGPLLLPVIYAVDQ